MNDDDENVLPGEAEMLEALITELNALFGDDAGSFAMKQLGPGMYAAVFEGDMSEEHQVQLAEILGQSPHVSSSFRMPDNCNLANVFANPPTETRN